MTKLAITSVSIGIFGLMLFVYLMITGTASGPVVVIAWAALAVQISLLGIDEYRKRC